jgi:[NiFe] hydrogenase assembly HybE family chaperone
MMTDATIALELRPAERLEEAFRAIHAQRMQGLPFLNEALQVEAVDFRRWEGRWLGVLITPWFMNLVLLPDAPSAWRSLAVRAEASYEFPAGVFEFIGGFEPAIGEFQSCSLFSPVFEFEGQDAARATAEAALAALFDVHTRSGAEGPGTARLEQTAAESAATAPVSKRDFLRGRWQGERT